MASMTKTEAKKRVSELRAEARRITDALTPPAKWLQREHGLKALTEEQVERIIEDALNNIDGISAMLREGLTDRRAY